jgi:hypothetical protein
MPLRGKTPKEINPRLKALLFGQAGSGKTMAAIQMPRPYIIDTENGCTHYGDIIHDRGGAVFATTSLDEAINEVKTLATESHDFLTLVIDPFTTLYDTQLDIGETTVGADFGRHYGFANKSCKRLYNLVAALDMNVIFTAHSKTEYAPGGAMKVLGQTFDGWRKMDYLFDLVFYLERHQNKDKTERMATVKKTRLKEFEDCSKFEWSYAALAERYGSKRLERKAAVIELASKEQVEKFESLLSKLSDAEKKRLKLDKVLSDYEDLSDMPSKRIAKGIDVVSEYVQSVSKKAV